MTQTTAPAPLARTTTEAVVASSLNRLEEKFPSQNFSVVDLCISPSSARLIDTLQQDLVAAARRREKEDGASRGAHPVPKLVAVLLQPNAKQSKQWTRTRTRKKMRMRMTAIKMKKRARVLKEILVERVS